VKAISWKTPENIEEYVRVVLAKEADDIPKKKIDAGTWILDEVDFELIKANKDMVTDHDQDSLHIGRKQGFLESFENNIPIYPLILLGTEMYLVDGYARYRALKHLGIKKIKVIKQLFNQTS
jgi:hypothetical protein